ncbi:MAG TPA: Ig-like domain-containing protein [Longimicrobium sp.]|nr:Ig-like domain-containing protein [Longimicrobium sp.]
MLRHAPAALLLAALAAACHDTPSQPNAPGPPDALSALAGDGQAATVGATLPQPLVVRLTDRFGRPVPHRALSFSIVSGGGSLRVEDGETSADGTASAVWTLGTGTTAGQQVAVRLAATHGEPWMGADFRATANPGAPERLVAVQAERKGTVGNPLAAPLEARVVDHWGNPVPGVEVAWTVTAGGGSVSPARSATDATGTARATWTLGPGLDPAQAAEAAAAGSRAEFTAMAGLGPGVVLAPVGGNAQRGTVGTRLPELLRVRLTLADGRPVPGAAVAWAAGAGAGTVLPVTVVTDAAGEATAGWVLGTRLRSATVTADASNPRPGYDVAGARALFTAGVAPGPPASLQGPRSDSYGPAGQPLAAPVAVTVLDNWGNPVPGIRVDWSIYYGGGWVEPATSVSDSSGVAVTRWTLGTSLGGTRLRASAGGLSTSIAATATGVQIISPGYGGQLYAGCVPQLREYTGCTVGANATGRTTVMRVTATLAGREVALVSPWRSPYFSASYGIVLNTTGIAPGLHEFRVKAFTLDGDSLIASLPVTVLPDPYPALGAPPGSTLRAAAPGTPAPCAGGARAPRGTAGQGTPAAAEPGGGAECR